MLHGINSIEIIDVSLFSSLKPLINSQALMVRYSTSRSEARLGMFIIVLRLARLMLFRLK
jgi:hypothetical protein